MGNDMKPKLLDLFCGAGGTSMGYYCAGFAVYGIDNKPQPHYPFPFLQMDALEAMDRLLRGEGLTFSNGETLYLADFDADHASPPCQFHSVMTELQKAKGQYREDYKNLIPITRQLLLATGKPFVLENVDSKSVRRDFDNPIRLCGSMFGLGVIRHRLFECNPFIFPPGHYPEKHRIVSQRADYCCVVGMGGVWRKRNGSRRTEDWMTAMDIDWMDRYGLTQAIPPAYTEYIGKYLMDAIRHRDK